LRDINLMPREYALIARRKKLSMLLLGLGAVLIVFLIIGIMTPYNMIKERQKTLAELNARKNDAKYEIINEVKQELNDKNQEKDSIENLINEVERNSIISRTTLDALIGLLPPGMHIGNLNANDDGKSIKLDGTALRVEDVAGYVVQINNLSFVNNVSMKYTSETIKLKDSSNEIMVVKYELNLDIKEQDGGLDRNEVSQDK